MTLEMASRYRDVAVGAAGRLLIGGRWVPTDETWPHVHPATNEHLTDIAAAGPADVDAAVAAARTAFDEGPWPALRARERRMLLRRVADAIAADAGTISTLQTLDNGMPFARSSRYRSSAAIVVDLLEYYAGWADKLTGETFPPYTAEDDLQYLTVLEPVGVVAAITAWNAPVLQFANKVAPALAAGCTVVVKPSEHASLATLRLAEIIAECDLPPGVLNLVTGTGPVAGDALIHHPGVDKVAFTGSAATGRRVVEAAAGGMKRTTLELGGKSPAVVFPDADLTAAAAEVGAVVFHGLTGQTCSAQTRALVHRDVYEDFVAAAVAEAERVVLGDPFASTTTAAPIVNAAQLAHIEACVESAVAEGARVVLRPERGTGPLAAGNWLTPGVFADVDNAGTLAQTEVFGPVLAVVPFTSEEEGVRMANATTYGLSAGVYTADMPRAFRVARALRSGTVGINAYSFLPSSPFGGVKASGLGREGGREGIDAYLETKTLMIDTGR